MWMAHDKIRANVIFMVDGVRGEGWTRKKIPSKRARKSWKVPPGWNEKRELLEEQLQSAWERGKGREHDGENRTKEEDMVRNAPHQNFQVTGFIDLLFSMCWRRKGGVCKICWQKATKRTFYFLKSPIDVSVAIISYVHW